MTTQQVPPPNKVDPFEVGWLFVQEYYTFLNREPQNLHRFYNKNSFFTHGHEGENVRLYHGQQEIHQRILSLEFENCKVLVSQVDSQKSSNDGIIIQVLGEMSNNGGASHKFAQTFFLDTQPKGYYVLNDIFRYLKEDIDNDYEESSDPTGEKEIEDHQALMNGVSAKHTPNVDAKPVPQPEANGKSSSTTNPTSPVKNSNQNRSLAPQSSKVEQIDKKVAEKSDETVGADSKPAWNAFSKPKHGSSEGKKGRHQSDQGDTRPNQSHQSAPSSTDGKPISWASLVGAAPSSTPNDVAVTSKSGPVSPVRQETQSPQPSPDKEEERDENAPVGAFQQVSNRRYDQRRNQNENGNIRTENRTQQEEKDKMSIYIKNIPENTTEKQIQEVFSKVGFIKSIDKVASRNIAFVEFTSLESVQKSIGASFTLNGATVIPEERKRQTPRRGQWGGRGRGGDGPFESGKQGRGTFRGRGGSGKSNNK